MAMQTAYRVPVLQSRYGSRFFALSGKYLGIALLAGAIGSVVMGLFLMIAMAVQGQGWYAPLHLTAAALPAFRPPAADFLLSAAIVGFGLHLITGTVWGLLYGLVVDPMPRQASRLGTASLLGLLWGVVAWIIMGEWLGPRLDPAAADSDPSLFLVAHLIFGLITAWSLSALVRVRTRTRPMGYAGERSG